MECLVYTKNMTQDILINVGTGTALTIILSALGAVVTGSWFLSQRLTRMETKIDGFDTRLFNLEGRVDSMFASASPVRLLEKGQTVLLDSGIKKYIDNNINIFLEKCAGDTQYEIQENAFKVFKEFDFGDFEKNIEAAAFNHGTSTDTIRRIGGIYFRDICLERHNFKPEDLDTPKE